MAEKKAAYAEYHRAQEQMRELLIHKANAAYLLGLDTPCPPPGFEPLPAMAMVPLVGSIACGTPITAEQNIEQYIGVPAAWHADFALTCQSLRLVSFGSKRPCLLRLSGTSHYSGRALFPVYMRKPKQARETNCYRGLSQSLCKIRFYNRTMLMII